MARHILYREHISSPFQSCLLLPNRTRQRLVLALVFWALVIPYSEGQQSQGGTGGLTQDQADLVRASSSAGHGNLNDVGLGAAHTSLLPDPFTGSLTASVAIPIPPGRGLISPSIDLSYRSGNGNGWLGKGWELELGAIQRNFRAGISYTTDSYSFETSAGEMDLVPKDGWYWAKIESSFTRFKRLESPNGSTYWLAVDRNGTKYFFGQDQSSRLNDPADLNRVFRWNLDRMQDTNGNFAVITYTKPDGTQTYPSEIRYTGQQNQSPATVVHFYIEQRSPSDTSTVYSSRFPIVDSWRLATIEVRTGVVGAFDGADLFAAYALSYTPSPATQRSLLKSVTQYGNDAVIQSGAVISGTSLPPRVFSYTGQDRPRSGRDNSVVVDQSIGQSGEWVDFNGDGRADYCRVIDFQRIGCIVFNDDGSSQDYQTTLPNSDVGYPDSRAWVDFNGDGKVDFCRIVGNAANQGLQPDGYFADCTLSTGLGWGATVRSQILHEVGQSVRAWVDINGDGKTDYCRIVTPYIPIIPSGPDPESWLLGLMPQGQLRCTLSTGTSFQSQEVMSQGDVTPGQLTGWAWVDFGGDRRLDFCRIVQKIVQVPDARGNTTNKTLYEPVCAFFTGNSFVDRALAPPDNFDPGEAFGRGWVDFNGDGLPDYCRVVAVNLNNPISQVESLRCSISDGVEFVSDVQSGPIDLTKPTTVETPEERAGRMWVDFNGDGLADFCRSVGHERSDQSGEAGPLQRHPRCTLSTGSAFGREYEWPNYETDQLWQRRWADAHGSGIADFCYVGTAETGKRAAQCLSNGTEPPDLLREVLNGMGGSTVIDYISSYKSTNSILPFPIQLVEAISTSDGRGSHQKITYSYEGGFWNIPAREFRGFQHVTETDLPDVTGDYRSTHTWFHQGDGTTPLADDPAAAVGFMKGKPFRTKVTDVRGHFSEDTTITYASLTTGSAPYFNPVLTARSMSCDDNQCESSTTTEYRYDEFGNVIFQHEFGLDTTTRGERTIIKRFFPNTTEWIVGFAGITAIYSGLKNPAQPPESCESANDGTLVSCVDYYYDAAPSCSTASTNRVPTKGNLTRTINWVANGTSPDTRAAYNVNGLPVCGQDANGNATYITYDSTGSLSIRVTSPLHHYTISTYYGIDGIPTDHGLYGQPKTARDVNGNESTFQYDPLGRVLYTKDFDGAETHFAYEHVGDPDAQVVRLTYDYGLETSRYTDGLGRVYKTRTTGPGKSIIRADSIYDDRGQLVRQSQPYFEHEETPRWTSTAYDTMGRVIESVQPNQAKTQYCYAALKTAVIDPAGHRRLESRDALGQLIKISQYSGRASYCSTEDDVPYTFAEIQYDTLGRPKEVKDPKGNTSVVVHDTLGRRVKARHLSGGEWSYDYDSVGNLIKQVDARGIATLLSYDEENRLKETTQTLNHKAQKVTYTYDDSQAPNGVGRLRSIADSNGSLLRYRYDANGRVIRIARLLKSTSFTTSYAFDKLGRLSTLVYPDTKTLAYEYDGPFLKRVRTDDRVYAEIGRRNAVGQVLETKYGNGVWEKHTYCPQYAGRLCAWETRDVHDVLLRQTTLSFDNVGNLSHISDPLNGDESFEYDDLNRLTRAVVKGKATSLAYDQLGNISFSSDRGSYLYSASVPERNGSPYEAVQVGKDHYEYDALGNQVSGPKRKIEYDLANRPIRVKTKCAVTENTFDGDGDRTQLTVRQRGFWPLRVLARSLIGRSTITGDTTYAGQDYRCESRGCTRLIFIEGSLSAAQDVSSGRTFYLHGDETGSIRMVTDDQGSVSARVSYSPFGRPVSRSKRLPPQVPFVYAGLELDKVSGLFLAGSRYYDPTLSMFLGADLAAPFVADSQSLNPYSYALNNPFVYADPSGKNPILIAMAIGALLGGLQAGVASHGDFTEILRGATIGAIAGTAGGVAGGGALGAAVGSATGAALTGANPLRAAGLGLLAYGVAYGLEPLGPYASAAIGGGVASAFGGENIAEGAIWGLAGSYVGSFAADSDNPQSMPDESPLAAASLTADVGGEGESGVDLFARNSALIKRVNLFEDRGGPLDEFGGAVAMAGGAVIAEYVGLDEAAASAIRSLGRDGPIFGTRFGGNKPIFNDNSYLRFGWSEIRSTGEFRFRISGKWVEQINSNGHINLWPPSWWFKK